MRRGLWMIFRCPLALAAKSSFGLISALLDDGIFDMLPWISLGVPLLLIVFVGMRMSRRPKEPR
ncbi:hypothetical protein [Pseudomonas nicosulfuronedens]